MGWRHYEPGERSKNNKHPDRLTGPCGNQCPFSRPSSLIREAHRFQFLLRGLMPQTTPSSNADIKYWVPKAYDSLSLRRVIQSTRLSPGFHNGCDFPPTSPYEHNESHSLFSARGTLVTKQCNQLDLGRSRSHRTRQLLADGR